MSKPTDTQSVGQGTLRLIGPSASQIQPALFDDPLRDRGAATRDLRFRMSVLTSSSHSVSSIPATVESPDADEPVPVTSQSPPITEDGLVATVVDIAVAELIVGRQLHRPIHDQNGVLLLAAGSIITTEFKRLLASRSIDRIQVDSRDANIVSLNNAALAETLATAPVPFDTELTKKLDAVINSGLLFVANTGSPQREKMVFHGRKAYDAEQRESLILQHQMSSESLDTMMLTALHGKKVNGNQISTLAANCLTDMTADSDLVLSISSAASTDRDLSDQALKLSLLGMAMGIEMGLDADNVRKLGIIGLVENWGMGRVPESIRNAQHTLTPMEFLEIKKHPIYALEMLENISGMPSLVPLVAYQMHERINGSGYPRGRCGASIHQFARILQVADIYVAMTSPRPYRQALMPYSVMVYLLNLAREKAIDPAVLRALLQVHSLFPIGSLVTLSDGSVARVIRRNQNDYMHPIVQRLQDVQGNAVDFEDPLQIVDLKAATLEVVEALPTPGKNEIAMLPEFEQPRQ